MEDQDVIVVKNIETVQQITIRFRHCDCEEMSFKVLMITSMDDLFFRYATHKGLDINEQKNLIEGERIPPGHTVATLYLEDGDQIDVFIGQSGC